jgi:hypothetical protein
MFGSSSGSPTGSDVRAKSDSGLEFYLSNLSVTGRHLAAAESPGAKLPEARSTAASLVGGFGYELRGFEGNPFSGAVSQIGRLNFDGSGHFTNTYTVDYQGFNEGCDTSQGTYTISSDCTTATLIFLATSPLACTST